jgi:serine phosphatase RsbU (regulator of sigma subunit)
VQAVPDPEILDIIRKLGLRSTMTVPLMAGGRPIGVMTFAAAESGRRYGPQDLATAEQLAGRAALAINNARLFEERDHIARVLQQSLLPPELPPIVGVELAARYQASGSAFDVGGDFYDAFDTGDGVWGLVIGDVCGKGPEAAGVTGLARHTVRAAAMNQGRPSEILATLNEAMVRQQNDARFCTVAYVRLKSDTRSTRATICCAGHPLPLVLRSDGAVETVGRAGTLLGIFPDPELTDSAVDLAPGDALVLFTDGVIEAHGADGDSAEERLRETLARCAGMSAARIAETIEGAVVQGRSAPTRDDIAILVAKVAQRMEGSP